MKQIKFSEKEELIFQKLTSKPYSIKQVSEQLGVHYSLLYLFLRRARKLKNKESQILQKLNELGY